MMASRLAPDLAITSAKRRWRGGRSPAASISAITMMPFIGVRISWLMVARKSDLARVGAPRPASLATRRSAVRSATVALQARHVVGDAPVAGADLAQHAR